MFNYIIIGTEKNVLLFFRNMCVYIEYKKSSCESKTHKHYQQQPPNYVSVAKHVCQTNFALI